MIRYDEQFRPGDIVQLVAEPNRLCNIIHRTPDGFWKSLNNMPLPFPCTDSYVRSTGGTMRLRAGWNNRQMDETTRADVEERDKRLRSRARQNMGLETN